MRLRRAPAAVVCFLSAALVCGQSSIFAQGNRETSPASSSSAATQFNQLPNGLEVRQGKLVLRITALRENVLRVRAASNGALPEDASWAVLASARASSAPVQPDSDAKNIGFHTGALSVSLNRTNLLMTVRDRSGRVVQQDAQPLSFDGDAFNVTKVMPADEHYFGLGDKTGPLDRRGQAFTLWNTDAYRFQESTDPIYKAIPFFLTDRAGESMGVLLDNTWRTSFDFGREGADVYSFGAVAGPLDYYLMLGPSPKQVIEEYAWLTGKPPLPPKWALGYQQSRYTYAPESKLMEVADRLRTDHIPADAVYLDIGFQDRNRPFTVDTKAFPDFAGTVAKLKKLDLHLVTITDLHIAKAPNQGYAPYDSGIAGDEFVHNPDGSVYTGVVWPGPSVFPDFTREATRKWWGTLYTTFVADGVDGFWNDMNEPSIFDTPTKTMPIDVIHRIEEPGFATRTATHAEIHNVYGMENSRATYEGLLQLQPDKRPFVMTRATYAGGQRYAVTWTGDDSSTWNHLRMSTFMLKNLGLSGMGFSGADVGGFAGSPPMDLLTRWLEIAAFEPIDRDHTEAGTAPQEPWVGGVEQENIRRRFIEERYRLMPYLYTVAEEASRTGVPMMRPLFLDYPKAASDGHPLDLDPGAAGEFLVGHDLIVAPSPYPEEPDTYTVELPTAEWYDYWTGTRVTDKPPAPSPIPGQPPAPTVPLSVDVQPSLASLPVYVRGGAILPIAPLTQSTTEIPQGPLTLRIYTGPDCQGSIYLDDGATFAYQHGHFLRENFTCQVDSDGLHITLSKRDGDYPAWWKTIHLQIYGWTPHKHILLQDGKQRAVELREEESATGLNVEDSGDGTSLVLQ